METRIILVLQVLGLMMFLTGTIASKNSSVLHICYSLPDFENNFFML